MEECDDGGVLWLRQQTPDAVTKTHHRICLDSQTNSATVYWMNSLEKVVSKTFRSAAGLRAWFTLDPTPTNPEAAIASALFILYK